MSIGGKESLLLQAIRQGNREAMATLYKTYAGYATAVVKRYVADPDEARDVLHDSFLKIFTRIDQFHFQGEGSLKAWMMRICANEALDYLRKQKRLAFADLTVDIPEDIEPDVERVPPDVLNNMIASLPTGYRAVLNLYIFEQMSHKEIASRLGIKEDSSASQFSRAKRQLAKMINEYLKNEDK